jgi:phosphoglycerate dehydrogenase-like enzyme
MSIPVQRPKVLICDKIAQSGVAMLQETADVDVKLGISPEELLEVIDNYNAVVVRSATKIRANAIERASKLQVIGRAGAGLDNIDVVIAQERGIKVVNAPNSNTRAVAEHTMALILALARRLPRAAQSMKEGRWEKSKLMGIGLAGKTLGIVGFGRIGREVAIRAQAFGMRVIVNQRRSTPELNLEANVQSLDLDDLLREADFVTLHVPSRPETVQMIGQQQLSLMKPTAFLLNTARGTIVDEAALLAALNDGKIAGAALDVFSKEPATDSQLVLHERVIATPHIGASTEDAQHSAAATVAQQIIDVLNAEEEQPTNPLGLRIVPLEKVLPHESVDPRRVKRLAGRLAEDGTLSNPPIVVEIDDHYVILDGATRITAMRELGFPHVVVQLASQQEGLSLHTWYHAVRKIAPASLLQALQEVKQIILKETDPEKMLDEMIEFGGLCYLHTVDGHVFIVQAAPEINHLEALNRLTEAYISVSHVTRTLDTDVDLLKAEFPDLSAVVVFPEYTVEHVLQIARAGHVLPAGITRFIIPGRVLRLNVDLMQLKSDSSLTEKNRWLNEEIINKFGKSKVRYYQESVYLLDE